VKRIIERGADASTIDIGRRIALDVAQKRLKSDQKIKEK
jgi:hypothetical protein